MSDLCDGLRGLAADLAAPEKARNRAEALLSRLMTPVRIAVAGPDQATAARLLDCLPKDLSDIAISDDVAKADIAIWCTQHFTAAEAAFWEAAPATLQDHSLLVGPPDAHIRDMGRVYFRNHCGPDGVTAILQRQVQQGKEADADQALALLARHPAAPVVAALTPQIPASCDDDDPLVAYLLSQADALCALDVTDTPESHGAVLALCAQTATQLCDMVSALPQRALQDAVFDTADSITLMALEGDLAAATDAVTALVSLKSHLQSAVSQFETNAVQ